MNTPVTAADIARILEQCDQAGPHAGPIVGSRAAYALDGVFAPHVASVAETCNIPLSEQISRA